MIATVNHNPDLIVGRSSAGTLRMWTDEKGLRYEITPPVNQHGKFVTDAVRRGDITGVSFMFKAEKQSFADEMRDGRRVKVRTLLSVRLADISLATTPAYAGASARLESPPMVTPEQPGTITKTRLMEAQEKFRKVRERKLNVDVANN